MKTKLIAAAIAAAAFATPALADFFIVREGATGPCRIVESRPTDAKFVVVGKAYRTRGEAESDVLVICK